MKRIVICYQSGLTPEEIAREYPHVNLTQVFAALTYYYANREEIDLDIAEERAIGDELEKDAVSMR